MIYSKPIELIGIKVLGKRDNRKGRYRHVPFHKNFASLFIQD